MKTPFHKASTNPNDSPEIAERLAHTPPETLELIHTRQHITGNAVELLKHTSQIVTEAAQVVPVVEVIDETPLPDYNHDELMEQMEFEARQNAEAAHENIDVIDVEQIVAAAQEADGREMELAA